MSGLNGKTVIITGSTRGIGRAMALRFAADGANVVITGKTKEPHPKLEGTLSSVAEEVIAAGGNALPLQLDVRDEDNIQTVVDETVKQFGGIDILINNASAIFLKGTLELELKRYDLMMDVNMRGTFAMSKACIPHLLKAENPHILNNAPPLNMEQKWFKDHLAYTYAKYGMSICTLGMSAEFKDKGLAVNSLWPQHPIATAAIKYNLPQLYDKCLKPSIVADAAYAIVTKNCREVTGNFFIDFEVLKQGGVTDFSQYGEIDDKLPKDFFLD